MTQARVHHTVLIFHPAWASTPAHSETQFSLSHKPHQTDQGIPSQKLSAEHAAALPKIPNMEKPSEGLEGKH